MDSAAGKARRARRVLDLCENLQRRQLGRAVALETELRMVAAREAQEIAHIDRQSDVLAPLSHMVLARAHSVSLERREIEKKLEIQAAANREATKRVRMAERLRDDADETLRDEQNAQELAAVLEHCLRPGKVSAP